VLASVHEYNELVLDSIWNVKEVPQRFPKKPMDTAGAAFFHRLYALQVSKY